MGWPTPQKFDDGDSLYCEKDKIIEVRLIDPEPSLYYTHYVNNKTVKCTSPECQHCTAGEKRIEKGSMLVMDMADRKQKKLKGTAALFIALREVLEMTGGMTGYIFSMKATGDKSQRRYHIVPKPAAGVETQSAPEKVEDVPF